MRDGKKRSNGKAGHQLAESATTTAKDAKSSKLIKQAKALGNEEIQQRIRSGNASRDELMTFIASRLGTIRDAQVAEMAQSNNERDWWKNVSDKGKPEYSKPKPTQWIEPAREYEQAAFQLARGALGVGTQLIERALDIEQKRFGGLSKVVEQRGLEKDASLPDVAGGVSTNQGCGEGEVPGEIHRLVHEIKNVTMVFDDVMNKKRIHDPWWTLEEEEEEEQSGGAA